VIVIDASALLEVVVQSTSAAAVEARIFAPGETLHAPHLIDIEIAHAIRRYLMRGDIDSARGAAAIDNLRDFQLRRYPHSGLLDRIWGLRSNMTAYDAAYVALAEALDAPLLTRDSRLGSAARRHVRVEIV
jgi:predicted nucleic acid-binding protein